MATTSDLGTKHIPSLLRQLAIPSIIAQVVNILYNIVDRIYIGQLADGAALGGLSVALPLITLIMAITQLLGTGGAPLAAIELGKNNKEKAETIMTNSFVALIVTGLAITVLVQLFATPLLTLFGADASTLPYGLSYATIYAYGTISVQIAFGMNPYINTQGFAKIGMRTVMIGAILNIILDPIFIFVFHLGVSGAAYATILSQTVSAIWVIRFLFSENSTLKLRLHHFRFDFHILASICALGISPCMMAATESFLQISFNNQLSAFGGPMAVSTMAILLSLCQLVTYPIQGITMGAQPILSYNYGARNYDRVRKCFRITFFTCLICSICFAGCIILFSPQITPFFSSNPTIQALSSWGIRIYLFGMMFFGAQIACQQSFMALGQAARSLSMAVFRKIVLLIPLIFILPSLFGNSAFASSLAAPIQDLVADGPRVACVFLAESVSDILAATATTTLFLLFYRKHLKEVPPAIQ